MYRSRTAPAGVWMGPLPAQAPAFQPRDDLRAGVDAARAEGRDVVLASADGRPGGVGTTQLAAWYAHQAVRDRADLVVWVDPTGPEAVMSAFAMAAALVGAPGRGETDPEEDARALLDWLNDTDRTWLIVFDGITDPEQVAEWWPQRHSPTGWFLATTRLPGPIASSGRAATVEVGVFSAQESRAYLTARLAGVGGDAIDDVAARLGQLPLALSHAAAYMVNEGVDCREYLVRLADQSPDQDAVAAGVSLAAEAANGQEPVGLALPLLRLAATLDPAAHPAAIWDAPEVARYLADQCTATGGPEYVDSAEAARAAAVLQAYGLLSVDPMNPIWTVRMHGDTAAAVRAATPTTVHRAAAQAAADAVLRIWPDPDDYPDGAAYVAVLRGNAAVLAGQEGDPLWHPEGHELLFRAGMSLSMAELHDAAERYWRMLVDGGERVLGPEHDDVLGARRHVATAMVGQGRADEALPLLRRLVASLTEANGERDETTLSALEHLAVAATASGQTREGVQAAERLVAGRNAVDGPQDEKTLKASWILATCYRFDGRPDDAITSIQPVVAGYSAMWGLEHPDTWAVRQMLAALRAESRAVGGTDPKAHSADA
ncbi:tetratricopeptide repeat protein [Micromonospora musae]|uniref:Tetratricopeptide repeat protein n=2 Tax=Micromonospora musae TaxID=1894970 RepID=A0ABX9QX05_9ACTN|nr:tetratricopeptide repeat protein [Micromonospora musae]